jgi:hypothetical protein
MPILSPNQSMPFGCRANRALACTTHEETHTEQNEQLSRVLAHAHPDEQARPEDKHGSR